jgi:hypothetical protein
MIYCQSLTHLTFNTRFLKWLALLLDNGPTASLVTPGVPHGSLVEDCLAGGVFSPEPVHDCPVGGPGRQRETWL